jgi:hypothetical protein
MLPSINKPTLFYEGSLESYELITLWPLSMIKLEFRNVDFCGGWKTGEPGEKPLKQGSQSTTNSTHM